MSEQKLAKQEQMKVDSKFLKGNIAEELADTSKVEVSDEAYEMLKFHGTYFGYNRDTATERKKQKLDKEYEFMVRTRIPGGCMTAQQYLAMDDLADKYANGTLKITTRQVFQFHVVLKDNLKAHIAAINHALLSTQSGCGDVTRNITASPAPYKSAQYDRLRADVEKVAEFVRPKTSAYKEIWLDEEADEVRERSVGEDYEPLYGATYMPRKFKIGLIVPEDNSVDVYTHDLGIILVFEGDKLKGYNILLGGGMGMDHEGRLAWKDKKTYPRTATPIAFVGPDELIPVVEATVKLQRDHGDRTNRKHARLKYLVQEKGTDWTRKTLQEYFTKAGGGQLQDPLDIKVQIPSHMGWHEQGDGKLFLGIKVPSGRIVDYDRSDDVAKSGYANYVTERFAKSKYRTGLREIVKKFSPEVILTPTGEMILAEIEPKDKDGINALMKQHNIFPAEDFTPMETHFFTCVALPTCAKALAESERVQFPIMQDVQAAMDKAGVGKERITVRVTGCPNGCARPYVGDIGIVGRMPGHYLIFIGGDFEGTRLNTRVLERVPQADIGKALEPMFAYYAEAKNENEGFGDFCTRVGVENVARKTVEACAGEKWAELTV